MSTAGQSKKGLSLIEAYPSLAALWHEKKNVDLKLEDVSAGSGKSFWWHCLEHDDHEWEARVVNQRKKPRCPFCAGTKTLTGFNDLSTVYPQVAEQFHTTLNEDVELSSLSVKSAQKLWWKCEKSHEWQSTVFNRTSGRGCPICSRYSVNRGETDLQSMVPDVAAQWHPAKNGNILASDVTAYSHAKAWWLCDEDHEWRAEINSRSRGNGCPFCANRMVIVNYNDITYVNPDLAAEWSIKNLYLADEVAFGSTKNAWWVCAIESSHEWEASPSDRSRGHGCPYCAGRLVSPGNNDLSTISPEIAREWHPTKNLPLLPSLVTNSSHKQIWWQCKDKAQHAWRTNVGSRTRLNGSGCPFCTGRAVLKGDNDLATLQPLLTYEWDYLLNSVMPDEVTVSSGKRMWWKCLKDGTHSWQATICDRVKGSQCPQCWSSSVTSQAERDICEFISSLGLVVESNVRTLLQGKQELDLYVPEKNFAVEFNGCYWHSEQFKSHTYHADKVQACRDAGIILYQVWEDDWKTHKEIVLRGIAHRLGKISELANTIPTLPDFYTESIGARQTQLLKLNFSTAAEFLDEHHIQGSVTGSCYLGLEDGYKRLRAVLVLTRTATKGEWLISRYASAGVVSGGFTKLLKNAEKLLKPERWVTFADRAISTGGLYDLTGFIVDKIIKPDYSYLVRGQRVHKFNYRLARFKSDPHLLYEDNKTEKELAEMNGLIRIWDSGKVRYVKDVEAK